MGLNRVMSGLLLVTLSTIPSETMAEDNAASSAVGGEVFVSTDSDDTTVVRTALDFDLRNTADGDRLGIRLEKAWYDPLDLGAEERERVFLHAGKRNSDGWDWFARVGTDGDTVIGSASINDNSRFRKEAFIERDIVETPLGLERGIYSTFVGAAIDIPADERNNFTVVGGVQEFTGENVRLHLRGNYVHVVKPEWGLSAQVRGRFFHSTEPGEFDYYSPEYYAQVLPVIQMRRFVEGWQLLAAGGIGLQRDSETNWRQANFAQLRIVSPPQNGWSVFGEAIFSQTPANSTTVGEGYGYFQSQLSILRRF